MEKVTKAESFILISCVPERVESQTLNPDVKNLQPLSSPGPATTLTSPSQCTLLLRQPPVDQGSAVSTLQSKMKALSECHKAAGSEAFKVGVKKKASTVASSRFSPVLVSWGSSGSDDDTDSQCSTFRPVVPDRAVEGSNVVGSDLGLLTHPRSLGEGSSLENLSDVSVSSLEDNFSRAGAPNPWATHEGLCKATRPETLLLVGDPFTAAGGPQQRKAQGHCRVRRELLRKDSMEGLGRCMGELGRHGPVGGLWRPDSLDSLCSNGSSVSLAERVEMNRGLLRQLLNKSQGPEEPGAKATVDREQRPEEVAQCKGQGFIALNDSDWDSGISLQDSEHSQRVFVSSEELLLSPRHEQAKRLLEGARMKARSFPLKADHTILPLQRDHPEQLSTFGASPNRAPLAGKEVASVSSLRVAAVTTPSGNLSDSSSGDSAYGPRGQSPTRVRFEDESEKDAEVRYLERLRQRRMAGERAQGLLISKPNLFSYVNGRRDTDQGNGTVTEQGCYQEGSSIWHQKGRMAQEVDLNSASEGRFQATAAQEVLNLQCHSCKTFLEDGNPAPNCHPKQSTLSGPSSLLNNEEKVPRRADPSESSRTVRTELIKETYIGMVTPGEVADSSRMMTSWAGETDTSGSVQAMKVRRRNSRVDQDKGVSPSPQIEHSIRVNYGVEVGSLRLTSNMGTVASSIRPASLPKTSSPPVGKMGNPEPEAPVEQNHSGMEELSLEGSNVITLPPYCSVGDVRVRGPMRVEHQREDSPSPTLRVGTQEDQRQGRPKLSLRRFFSAFGLNGVGKLGKGRSSSMEQLSVQPRVLPPASPGTGTTSSPVSSPERPESSQLRKAPSLQSLRMGSPFMQLRKASSVQNVQSWKKGDRSSAYKPGDAPRSPALSRGLQRALSVEDVGGPSGMRSVGRVAQAFSDGTFLLELSRPPDGPFGFLISRGKGRPDSGVYVEEMCDSSTEKLYAGLLGVGDELLEVNGEKVAGLSLDLVTRLMTQGGVTSVRVLRHRRLPPPR
ncbi:hypothetical protein DPEC_G00270540 [Dallia pectoralis]|uniref:Uncharacterized protein n=1 Tax=Dallia pectoralis TaxID=75939 RepID=A0ACC2FPH0_DALPE|nr:hypothetical protein DPEC_G00270540 [Dallia pectoralis]